MPTRWLILVLLLAVETGCPHAWGKGGTIDMAVEKSMWENAGSWKQSCRLTPEEWVEKCQDLKYRPESEKWKCPKECVSDD